MLALLLASAGTAAAASDTSLEAVDRTAVARSAPAADAVVERLDALGRADRAAVFTPLVDVVNSIAASEGSRLDPADAAAYERAVRTAHAAVQHRLASSVPAAAAADPVSDLLTELQSSIDGILGALTSLDLGAVLGQVTGLLTPVIGLVTGVLGGGATEATTVPTADLPAATELTTVPTADLPAATELTTVPTADLPATAPLTG